MKDGLIVYLVGETSLPKGFDPVLAARELGQRADRVEVVALEQGFSAWRTPGISS
jgi:hypothetical protein